MPRPEKAVCMVRRTRWITKRLASWYCHSGLVEPRPLQKSLHGRFRSGQKESRPALSLLSVRNREWTQKSEQKFAGKDLKGHCRFGLICPFPPRDFRSRWRFWMAQYQSEASMRRGLASATNAPLCLSMKRQTEQSDTDARESPWSDSSSKAGKVRRPWESAVSAMGSYPLRA